MQTTPAGRTWVGYSDEAIFGTGLGSSCFAAFELDGTPVFKYWDVAPELGLPQPLNVDALNVVDDAEVWALGAGEYSILAKMDGLSIAETWVWRNVGSNPGSAGPYGTALAVGGERVLVGNGSSSEVRLFDLRTRKSRRLRVVHEDRPLLPERATGRGGLLYLTAGDALYTVDLADIPDL